MAKNWRHFILFTITLTLFKIQTSQPAVTSIGEVVTCTTTSLVVNVTRGETLTGIPYTFGYKDNSDCYVTGTGPYVITYTSTTACGTLENDGVYMTLVTVPKYNTGLGTVEDEMLNITCKPLRSKTLSLTSGGISFSANENSNGTSLSTAEVTVCNNQGLRVEVTRHASFSGVPYSYGYLDNPLCGVTGAAPTFIVTFSSLTSCGITEDNGVYSASLIVPKRLDGIETGEDEILPVTCSPGVPITTTPAVVIAEVGYGVGLTYEGLEYTPELNTTESQSYEEIANATCEEVDRVYLSSPLADTYLRCEVVSMRQGSVIVDFLVFFKPTPVVPEPKIDNDYIPILLSHIEETKEESNKTNNTNVNSYMANSTASIQLNIKGRVITVTAAPFTTTGSDVTTAETPDITVKIDTLWLAIATGLPCAILVITLLVVIWVVVRLRRRKVF